MTKQEKFDFVINQIVADVQPFYPEKKLTRYSKEILPSLLGVFSALVSDEWLDHTIKVLAVKAED